MRNLIIAVLGIASTLPALQAFALPSCDPAVAVNLRKADGEERAARRTSASYAQTLIYDFDTHSGEWFFEVRYVIGEDGRVTCISPGSPYAPSPPEITPQRQAALDAISAQQFAPFLTKGEPAPVYVETVFYEEERPGPHVPRPAGDIATAEIRLHWSSRGEPPSFDMVVRGDGTVTYSPGRYGDLFGPQTYRIPLERVAAIMNLAEAAQFWSLREVYHYDMPGHGWSYSKIDIRLGESFKTFSDDGSGGTPSEAGRLIHTMSALAEAGLWQKIDRRTLDVVKENGFDFASDKGAELLMTLVSAPATSEDVVAHLLSLGAPQDRVIKGFPFDYSLLDAAIAGQRFELANRLIDQGALTTKGQPDRAAVTRALAHAVQSGSPDMVRRLLSLGPELVIRRNDATQKIDPIITFVRRPPNGRQADTIAIIQLLLDSGADIDSRDTFNSGVLNYAANRGDADTLSWLLNKGARIEASDGTSPLDQIYDEDIVMILLEGGADLAQPGVVDELVSKARRDHWLRVTAWLRAYGKWPDS
ncbi:hypothetical protein ABAC460_21065 [Asticcacaulis sp. AC460]|uniref:ankyrin repeat domain-containing protein n=1 Tax=Asticcacaulis sp. AC460 TaxID=1282360 RepID=UPI0003C3C82E|nr:ankyrin repeat domain-containing protein [Asticcacaulis sp. AC460]ESQ87062.1 hypothetical protein ABAC460_21065 [Asticcacaulis sp. AC460]